MNELNKKKKKQKKKIQADILRNKSWPKMYKT